MGRGNKNGSREILTWGYEEKIIYIKKKRFNVEKKMSTNRGHREQGKGEDEERKEEERKRKRVLERSILLVLLIANLQECPGLYTFGGERRGRERGEREGRGGKGGWRKDIGRKDGMEKQREEESTEGGREGIQRRKRWKELRQGVKERREGGLEGRKMKGRKMEGRKMEGRKEEW